VVARGVPFGVGRPRVTSAKRSERLVRILASVNERKSVSLVDLAADLGVSAATMRRDLTELEEQGLVSRIHGGARAFVGAPELPVRLRDNQSRDAKRAIARVVTRLLPDRQLAIAVSGGTTTAEVVRALAAREDLTIVTNSLTTASEIAWRPNLRVIMTGGVVRPSSFELVGSLAENTFNAINVEVAVLGTDGISSRGGATTHDDREARTNAAMATNSARLIVAADGSKVGRVTLAKVADIREVHDLVTDASADAAELDRIRAAGVTVHIADV
jgi:DeoR family transcriptional regulator, aga operon transcriptional repressor